jgi:hypothetical protein
MTNKVIKRREYKKWLRHSTYRFSKWTSEELYGKYNSNEYGF